LKDKNRHGVFIYRSCRKRASTGYRIVAYEGYKVLIADEEKALVDFLLYIKYNFYLFRTQMTADNQDF